MSMTPRQRRSEHRARIHSMVDMNLVSLIDIFTILIFFLLANSTEVETLTNNKAVSLPLSSAEKAPRETVVVIVNNDEILVQGRKVASTAEAMSTEGDLIGPLKTELDLLASRQIIRPDREALKQAITIMGDKQIPYRLLRKVMFTCARANYSDMSFAVLRKNQV